MKDKIVRRSLAEISGSTRNKTDYEEFMTHTASAAWISYGNIQKSEYLSGMTFEVNINLKTEMYLKFINHYF